MIVLMLVLAVVSLAVIAFVVVASRYGNPSDGE